MGLLVMDESLLIGSRFASCVDNLINRPGQSDFTQPVQAHLQANYPTPLHSPESYLAGDLVLALSSSLRQPRRRIYNP
jgi:hypothetical protein